MNSGEIHFHPGLMISSSVSFAKFCDIAPQMMREYVSSVSIDGTQRQTLYPVKYILPFHSSYINDFIKINSEFRAYNLKKMPSNYSLLVMPDKTFSNLVKSLNSSMEINFLQYRYHLGQCRAYHVMVARKVEKLILSSLHCLRCDDIPGAAATARSAIENAARFCVFANKAGQYLTEFPTSKRILAKTIVGLDKEFEKLHQEHLYASNSFVGDVDDETKETITGIRHINALHDLDKAIKKQAGMKEHLKKNYAVLCDLTHPNVSSNFSEAAQVLRFGSEEDFGEYDVVNFTNEGELSHQQVIYISHIITALSFSAGTMHLSSELLVRPFERISSKLGFGNTYKSFSGLMDT